MKLAPIVCVSVLGVPAFTQQSGAVAQGFGEIRGRVVEATTNQGIAAVRIFVYYWPPGAPSAVSREIANTTTDGQGSFRFQPDKEGAYSFGALKDGYSVLTNNAVPGTGRIMSVEVRKGDSLHEIQFLMGRSGQISGKLVDWDSGEPIANREVVAESILYLREMPRVMYGRQATTDKQGEFVVSGLDPGKYVIAFNQRLTSRPILQADPPAREANRIDEDYQRSFWPGGGTLDDMLPASLISGGAVDLGTIRIRKEPFYRVHVSLSKGDCAPEQRAEVFSARVDHAFAGQMNIGDIACGQEFLVKGYEQGHYDLVLTQGKGPARTRSLLSFDVVDKNLDFIATLAHGVDIDGTIVAAEGATKIAFENLKVGMSSLEGAGFPDERIPVSPDSKGKFKLVNQPPAGKFAVGLVQVQRGSYYIKEIRANGAAMADGFLTLNPYSPAQSIEIVVDDQPATVAGGVREGENAVNRPYVTLAPWPLPSQIYYANLKTMTGDSEGKFRFTGLAPGEYRAIAVAEADPNVLEQPGVLRRLAERAEKIELQRGGVATISLKLSDVSH
jgi:hypothetical protein